MGRLTSRSVAIATTVLVLLAADSCSDPTLVTGRLKPNAGLLRNGTPTPQPSTVCKVGPAGDYTVQISGATSGTFLVSNPFTIAAGECKDVYQGSTQTDLIHVSEINLPPNTALDHITLQLKGGDCADDAAYCPVTLTGTNTADFETFAMSPYIVTFFNKPTICTDQTAMNFGGPLPCVFPPEPTPCPAGSFSFNFLANGDLFIRYDQFPAPNDNSYGVNAIGWPNGHTFNNLVGSDHAGFQLVDGNGVVRLSFNVDYLSANASAPSGFASLGVNGGDGQMIVGTATGISATTSLDRNLNGVNIPGLFNAAHVQQFGSVNVLLNSPPTDAAHTTYTISDASLAGWDFHDTYFVTISAAKLASIGFNPSTWQVLPNPDQLHNSPAKPCPPSGDQLSITKYEVKDKQVKITIQNTGSTAVFLTALTLTWPQAVNGNLVQVKLDGDVVYSGPAIGGGSANLTTAQLVADQNKRKIDHGSSDVYTLIFANNADANLANYTGTVTFGATTLTVLPH